MRFQSMWVVAKIWSRRWQPNILVIVAFATCWFAAGCGGSQPNPERCGPIVTVNGQPQVVVVLIDGAPSKEDGGKFYPVPVNHPDNAIPVVTSYCPVDPEGHERGKVSKDDHGDDYGWPPGLSQGLRRWSEFKVPSAFGASPPQVTGACADTWINELGGVREGALSKHNINTDKDYCLVARLADAGAVLLPYSYAGATLSEQSSGPVFDMHAYDGATSKQKPSISVQKLDDELYSIHNVWKGARIVVVGHSYGGLIAELWWECILGHCLFHLKLPPDDYSDHRGVMDVFSLDSPINGAKYYKNLAVYYGGPISELWGGLWPLLPKRDPLIINLDAATSVQYTAVGTPDDPTYNDALLVGDIGNIQSQVVYRCDRDNEQCIAQPPSYVLGAPNAPECVGNGVHIYGTTGHDIVKVCPQVVKRILQSVLSARDSGKQLDGSPGTSSPTLTSPQSTQTTPSGDLTQVDWANFTYFSSCFGNQRPFKAKGGQATNGWILFQVNLPPTYGDLTGDGQPEAIISYSCTGAYSGGVHVLIYTGNAAHPVLIGDLPHTDQNDKLATVDTVNISNGDLQLTGQGYSPTAASCCPDLYVNNSYHWNGSRFVLVNSAVT